VRGVTYTHYRWRAMCGMRVSPTANIANRQPEWPQKKDALPSLLSIAFPARVLAFSVQ